MLNFGSVGRYQLLDRIGSGGMAEVHLARVAGAAGFEKLVVVKRLLPALAAEKEYVRGFVDEGRIAATFSHANVVSTFDFGESDGAYFIAMEFVEGKNLRALLDALDASGERMPLPAALYLAAETCRGLDHAHTRTDAAGHPLHVVHRDVSPQNIVVSYDGDVKVLDFGIATSASRETRTAPGIVKGKLRYIAPEQVMGGIVDGRADLFAVGAIVHEILHGRRTLPDLEGPEIIPWVTRAEFPPARPEDGVPADVDALLARALSADPAARPPTCGEMARELARLLAHHWPDFAPADLASLTRRLFAEERIAEREWVRSALENSDLSRAAPRSLALPDAPMSESKVLTLATDGNRRPAKASRAPSFSLAALGVALALVAAGWLMPHARRVHATDDARAALAAGQARKAFEIAAGALDHGADPALEDLARQALRVRLDEAYSDLELATAAPALVGTAMTAHPSIEWLESYRAEATAAAELSGAITGKTTQGRDIVRKAFELVQTYPTDPNVPWAEAQVVLRAHLEPGIRLALMGEAVRRGHPGTSAVRATIEEVLLEDPPQDDDGRDALALFARLFPEDRAAFASRYLDSGTNAIAAMSARALTRQLGGNVPPNPVFDALERTLDGKGGREDDDTIVREAGTSPSRLEDLLLALERDSPRSDALEPLRNRLYSLRK